MSSTEWQTNPAKCKTIATQVENPAMSVQGHKATKIGTFEYVGYWELSGPNQRKS
jgi:hypothetical protein